MKINDKITIFKNGEEHLYEVSGSHVNWERWEYRIFMVVNIDSPEEGYFVGLVEPKEENSTKIIIPFSHNHERLFSEHPLFRKLVSMIELIKGASTA